MIRKLSMLMFFVATALAVNAQPSNPISKIPADTAVRIGTLDNGMKYYIRHNSKPENQGEFYIFHNVGAIQEEDSQVGLAHFLEHMAFNGTKNLPDKMLINYLETIGVKFGANLNAGTGQDMTVYNMSSVPLTREGIIDTALLILHDWSHFITLDPEEIDKERGVIIEELRTGNNAEFRIREETNPTLYNNAKYARRNIIGNEENLRNFSHQELVDFYHRWYRPDLQTLVVVGDFDVDAIEKKIIELMSDIPAVENPEKKVMYPIPGNEKPLVAVATDPELSTSSVDFIIKHQPIPYEQNDYYFVAMYNTMRSAVTRMGNYRLYDITQKPNAPFVTAYFAQGSMTATMDVFLGSIVARNGEIASAFKAFYTEVERIRRYGFTMSELERVKAELLRAAESEYDNRFDRRNSDFVWTYINNYRKNSPMPTADTQWEMDSLYISNLDLGEINMFAKKLIEAQNEVVIASSPEKDDIAVPTEDELRNIMSEVMKSEIDQPVDDVVKVPLIDEELKGGKVINTEEDIFGATVWTLDNGVKVVIKPTDFRADEVITNIRARGGISSVSDKEYPTADILNHYLAVAGVGKFPSTELLRQLAGKSVTFRPTLSAYERGFAGNASVKDFETLLQLTYLNFTSPRFDKDDYDMMMGKLETNFSNSKNDPDMIFADSMNNTLYDHNIRRQIITLDRLKLVEFEKMEPIYRKLFDNAAEFTFIYSGNLNLEEIKPLIEKYIGSLPTQKEKSTWVDDNVRMVEGDVTNRFTTPMKAPKNTVMYVYSGDIDYTPENILTMDVLSQILRIRYTESIREEKGGTYGVSVRGSLYSFPKEEYMIYVYFDTNPEMVDELIEIVTQEIRNIAESGPKAEDLSKIKEFLVKQRSDNLKRNGAWIGFMYNYYIKDIDLNSDYDRLVKELDSDKIKSLAAKILADKNLTKIIMDPAKEDK